MYNFKCLRCNKQLKPCDQFSGNSKYYSCSYDPLNKECYPITNYYSSYIQVYDNRIVKYWFVLPHENDFYLLYSDDYLINASLTQIKSFSKLRKHNNMLFSNNIFNLDKFFPITFDNYAQEALKILNLLLKLSIFAD